MVRDDGDVGEAGVLLAELGATSGALTADERGSLDDDGYVVLRDVLTDDEVDDALAMIAERLEAARADQSWTPGGTLHLDDVTDGGPAIDRAWSHPRVLAAVAELVGDNFRLSRVHYRGPQPGYGAQHLHADGAPPYEAGHHCLGATAIVSLVDFTVLNGPTRVIPGSHRPDRSREVEAAAGAPAVKRLKLVPDHPHPRQQLVTCPAGSAIVFAASLWHSGTRNDADHVRHALQIGYLRRGLGFYDSPPNVSNETVDRLGDAALLLI